MARSFGAALVDGAPRRGGKRKRLEFALPGLERPATNSRQKPRATFLGQALFRPAKAEGPISSGHAHRWGSDKLKNFLFSELFTRLQYIVGWKVNWWFISCSYLPRPSLLRYSCACPAPSHKSGCWRKKADEGWVTESVPDKLPKGGGSLDTCRRYAQNVENWRTRTSVCRGGMRVEK